MKANIFHEVAMAIIDKHVPERVRKISKCYTFALYLNAVEQTKVLPAKN